MNTLRDKGKKIVSGLLAPLMLAGALYFSPKKAYAEEKKETAPVELKLENTFGGLESITNEKLRTTLTAGDFLFRVDKNEGKQSQFLMTYKALDKKNIKLSFVSAGDIAENDKAPTFAFGATLLQRLQNMPLFGDSTLKISQLNSVKKNDGPINKLIVGLQGKSLDAMYQITANRERQTESRYYAALHNDHVFASLGKTGGKTMEYILLTMNNPKFGVCVYGSYNFDSNVFNFTMQNAYKNADMGTYNLPIARLASDLLTLGTLDVNFPKFSSGLTFGDITHEVNMTTSPGRFRMDHQLGMALNSKIGVGGGLTFEKNSGTELKTTPIVSVYARPKIFGQEIYI